MRFTIRATQAGDIAEIAGIYADAVLHGTASFELIPPDEAELRRRWQDLVVRGYPHLVAADGAAVLGYAYAGPYRPRPAYRYTVENSVYVRPGAQGYGVGRALLGELVERCAAGDFRQMIAVIGGGSEHPASVGLHRAHGFREIGIVEGCGFKHGRWLDTLLMQRALGPGRTAPPDDAAS